MNRIAIATKKTIIFITHAVDEAAFLGDRCFVFSARPGRLKAIVDINIARDKRIWSEMNVDKEFLSSRDEILRLVREEVNVAIEE